MVAVGAIDAVRGFHAVHFSEKTRQGLAVDGCKIWGSTLVSDSTAKMVMVLYS